VKAELESVAVAALSVAGYARLPTRTSSGARGWGPARSMRSSSASSARVEAAAQLLGDIEDARDAAQVAAEARHPAAQFRGDCQFSTWLHRIVVNTCRDLAERQACAEEPLAVEYEPCSRTTIPCRLALVATCAGSSPRRLPG
jgi:hypothetical protein